VLLIGEELVLGSYEVALHPPHIDFAAFMDFIRMFGYDEIRVVLEDLLLRCKQKLMGLMQKEAIAAG
jgi:hypothetical protein